MDKNKSIDEYILEEQAKADALYPHTRKDVEPVLEGAYKGALVGGLGLRIFDSARSKKTGLIGTLAHIGTGAVAGGAYGKISNNKKVDKAIEARKLLAGKRVSDQYLKKKIDLVKQSSAGNYLIVKTAGLSRSAELATNELDEQKRKRKENQENVGKAALFGGGVGGVMGGIVNSFRRKGFIKGFVPMAVMGGANSAATAELDNKEENVLSPAALSGAGMAIGAGVEPLTSRLLGRAYKSVGSTPDTYFDKDELKDIKKGEVWSRAGERAKGSKKILHSLSKYLLPNMMSKTKHNYNSDDIDLYKGMKGSPVLDKSLLGHTAGKALWGGVLGYGLVKLPELWMKHQKEKQKQ